MNPVSIISDIQICYNLGKILVDFCQRWKDANAELADRVTTVELCWVNTKKQLSLAEALKTHLNDEIWRIFAASLDVLARKLKLAIVQVHKLQDPSSTARRGFLNFRGRAKGAKYALYQSTLDATIRDLEEWQARCKTTLDLNMRDPNPAIDQTLKRLRETEQEQNQQGDSAATSARGHKHTAVTTASPLSLTGGIREALKPTGTPASVFLPTVPFSSSNIAFSRAKAACMQSANNKNRWFILDTLPCRPETDIRALNDDVRHLAHKLRRANPFAFGLLSCKGVMRRFGSPSQQDVIGFDLVFNVPEYTDATQMKSLRSLLLRREGGGALSLSKRMKLAQELATSVSYVHTFNFVHKNIRPESVLLFGGEGSSLVKGGSTVAINHRRRSFLIGFESFRSGGGKTSLMGDQDWEHNIYRHPERMGEFPAEEYKMQHDIYSLGVCLLEIGLWEPLVEYCGAETDPMSRYGRVCREFVEMKKPWVFFKQHLVELAQNELPCKMGERYTEVVTTCLTCLDKDGNFGDQGETNDTDGILVGVRFIETIFERLNEIVL